MRKRNKISITLTLEDATDIRHWMEEVFTDAELVVSDNALFSYSILEQLRKDIKEAKEHNERCDRLEAEKKAAEDKLHQLFSMMRAARRRGDQRTVHFPEITKSAFTWEMESVNIFNSPTKAKFHWYQPRKRVVWLKFEPGDITNSLFDDDQFAFDLSEAVLLGFMSEETFNLKKEVV